MNKINQPKQKMTQLEVIEQVVLLAKDCELTSSFFKQAAPFLQAIAGKQNLTTNQTLMLCLIMNFFDQSGVQLGDLANHVGLSTLHLMKYLNDIDELAARGFVKRIVKRNGESYSVRNDVINALRQDKTYVVPNHRSITCVELFDVVAEIFNDENDYHYQQEQIMNLLRENPQLPLTQAIKAYRLSDDDTVLLMAFCHLYVDNEDDMIEMDDINSLIANNRLVRSWHRQLAKEQHPLQQKKLISFSKMGPMVDSKFYCLSDEAKCMLLGEMGCTPKKKAKSSSLPKDFVSYKSVVAKQMFYTQGNESQVARLAELLEDEKFRGVCRRIKQRGMRTGFACLFYGAPGTGKTETVMQLARRTKRNVMVVDFSQIRSKWVGDSEKNIKGVFMRYRDFSAKMRRKPILLFNEADAVIGIRREEATYSVDKMENTMQNIILQEMEQFDGIMIATTNLVQNMDSAFERRFLYKIQFERPDARVRARLWQEMIPELDDEQCKKLGDEFDLSGGQIENVARKYAINSILNDIEPVDCLNELAGLCHEERINDTKSDRRHVGFVP